MKQLSLLEIIDIFKSHLNEDVCHIIFKFYYKYPKFNKGENALQSIGDNIYRIVNIYNYDTYSYCPKKGYLYNYDYYPTSEGYCYEINLKKMTKEQKKRYCFTGILIKKKNIFMRLI